jgi:6-phosphogluconolactonase (cycloisomerase 2 family)
MRICSLGSLARGLFVPALLLVLAGCGTDNTNSNNNNQSGDMCSGCSFVYATTNTNQLLSFKVEPGGALGAPASTQGGADSPAIIGGGPLYESAPANNAIDAFDVNSSNGTLTAIAGSPFSIGSSAGSPAGLLFANNYSGSYLYVGDTNGTIAAFNAASSGVLTALSGSPFPAGVAPVNLAWSYNSNTGASFLYAADFSGGGIYGFTIDSNGALTPVAGSPFATAPGSAPAAMVVGAGATGGGTLYVALSALNEIAAYSVQDSGALTALTGSPFLAGRGPATLLAYSNFFYSLNGLDHTISGYSVDLNTGVLTEIAGSPFPAGTALAGLIDGHNGDIYVPDTQSNGILGFSVNATTGSLTPLAGSPFLTSAGPVALTSVAFPVLDPP